jgi:hypothetical protein
MTSIFSRVDQRRPFKAPHCTTCPCSDSVRDSDRRAPREWQYGL